MIRAGLLRNDITEDNGCSPTAIFLVFRISAVAAAVAVPGVFGVAVNSDQRTKSCLPDLTFLERKI